MKSGLLQTFADAMKGTLPHGGGEQELSGVISTDTRNIPRGALFFALKGENFDAHDFLGHAAKAGAGALVAEDLSKAPADVPVILVNDTLQALQDLAEWYRQELGIPVVAITGSNGKTSTKDFVKSVLSQKYRVSATLGNLNNHIGLPLSVLATTEDHEVGIFEMGMNHSGELAPLCQIAQPDISVITNVGTAHIEFMGSREAIAEEKGTVARALKKEGTLVIPGDCDFLADYQKSTKGEILTVGQGKIRAEKIRSHRDGSAFTLIIDGLGEIETSITVPGQHMITNALLAAGVGVTLKLSLQQIAKGLSEASLTSGRLRQYQYRGIGVIDDTYNANPESVAAGLETLAGMGIPGKKIAVLGKMAELGNHAQAAYAELGRLAAELGLTLVSVGAEADGMGAPHQFHQTEDAANWLAANTHSGDLVLFKGSRAAAMERVMTKAFPE